MSEIDSRRGALKGLGLSAAALVVGCAGGSRAEGPTRGDESSGAEAGPGGGDVPAPSVDLMKEHGLLDRVLLVYDASARRLEAGEPVEGDIVRGAAEVIRDFVQEVHEEIEEQLVFPLLRDAGEQEALIATLLRQHEVGRALTAWILEHASDADAGLAEALRAFSGMYRPHAGREDTVLFVRFREVATPDQLRSVMEGIEELEHARMGDDGWDRFVRRVEDLERRLSIHELGAFTPELPLSAE